MNDELTAPNTANEMWIVSGCGVSFIVPKDKVEERMAEIIDRGGLPIVKRYEAIS